MLRIYDDMFRIYDNVSGEWINMFLEGMTLERARQKCRELKAGAWSNSTLQIRLGKAVVETY